VGKWLESVHTLYAHYDSAGIYFAIRPKSEPPPNFYGPMKYNDEAANAFIGRSPMSTTILPMHDPALLRLQ